MTVRRRVTLAEVAGRAGVSATTASYILNDRSTQMRISPGTDARVRQAALDLGYRPNRSARSLRTSRTATIGLISDFAAGGHFASQMLRGAGAAAHQQDHLLLIGESEGDPEVELALVEEMADRQVDGILYARVATSEVHLPGALLSQNLVLLNCVDPGVGVRAVLPDEQAGGRSAAEALLRGEVRGEVVLVGEDPWPGVTSGRERRRGVEEVLSGSGRELGGVLDCPWDVQPGYTAVRDRLAEGDPPAALICMNDRLAMGAYRALDENGLDVPGDVSVVSFDGSELAGWLRPALTSVAMPYEEMGALAARRLLAPEPGPPGEPVVRVRMQLLEGGSVRPARPARVPRVDAREGSP